MTTLVQVSIKFSACNILHEDKCRKPFKYTSVPALKIASNACLCRSRFHLRGYREKWSFMEVGWDKGGVLGEDEGLKWKRRVVLVRFNQGLGPPGGGGGGGKDDGATGRLLGNIAIAAGLTYLSVTGQLGWILDAIVSIWLVAFLIPIVGLGAFIWWAGRDIVVGTCPNCGNDFQIFSKQRRAIVPILYSAFLWVLKSVAQIPSLISVEGYEQPLKTVVDDKFVKDAVKFSNQSTTFGQAFSRSEKGKNSSTAVVDVEAEVKDAD